MRKDFVFSVVLLQCVKVVSHLLAPYARSVRAVGKVSLWSFVKTLRHKEVYEL